MKCFTFIGVVVLPGRRQATHESVHYGIGERAGLIFSARPFPRAGSRMFEKIRDTMEAYTGRDIIVHVRQQLIYSHYF